MNKELVSGSAIFKYELDVEKHPEGYQIFVPDYLRLWMSDIHYMRKDQQQKWIKPHKKYDTEENQIKGEIAEEVVIRWLINNWGDTAVIRSDYYTAPHDVMLPAPFYRTDIKSMRRAKMPSNFPGFYALGNVHAEQVDKQQKGSVDTYLFCTTVLPYVYVTHWQFADTFWELHHRGSLSPKNQKSIDARGDNKEENRPAAIRVDQGLSIREFVRIMNGN